MGLAGAHVTGGDGDVSIARIDHFGVVPGTVTANALSLWRWLSFPCAVWLFWFRDGVGDGYGLKGSSPWRPRLPTALPKEGVGCRGWDCGLEIVAARVLDLGVACQT